MHFCCKYTQITTQQRLNQCLLCVRNGAFMVCKRLCVPMRSVLRNHKHIISRRYSAQENPRKPAEWRSGRNQNWHRWPILDAGFQPNVLMTFFFPSLCFSPAEWLHNSWACRDVPPQAWEVHWQQVWAVLSSSAESQEHSNTGVQLAKDQAICFSILEACKKTFLLPSFFFFFESAEYFRTSQDSLSWGFHYWH